MMRFWSETTEIKNGILILKVLIILVTLLCMKNLFARWFVLNHVLVQYEDQKLVDFQQLKNWLADDNILSVDLSELREKLLAQEKVAEVHIERMLPDTLYIELKSHHPQAQLPDGRLVSITGEVYHDVSHEFLPIFIGPARQVGQMVNFYQDTEGALHRLDLAIVQIEVTSEGLWVVYLNNGTILNLGHRAARRSRLLRFVEMYPTLARQFADISEIDLSYTEGMAIRGSLSTDEESEG